MYNEESLSKKLSRWVLYYIEVLLWKEDLHTRLFNSCYNDVFLSYKPVKKASRSPDGKQSLKIDVKSLKSATVTAIHESYETKSLYNQNHIFNNIKKI